MTGWGEGPARPDPDEPKTEPSRISKDPVPDEQVGANPPLAPDPASEPITDVEPKPRPDPVGVIAVGIGFVGIVFLGIVCALVAGVLGAVAGQRAREAGRSFELAYLAFILAAVDGVVWIALHFLFKLPIQFG